MPRLIWSRLALLDVQRLHLFLADNDSEAARRAVRVIRNAVRTIERQPQAGRPVEGMDPEYREWVIEFGSSGYIVLYRLDGDTAVLLSIRHQREAGY